jgi:hypothetical protein
MVAGRDDGVVLVLICGTGDMGNVIGLGRGLGVNCDYKARHRVATW